MSVFSVFSPVFVQIHVHRRSAFRITPNSAPYKHTWLGCFNLKIPKIIALLYVRDRKKLNHPTLGVSRLSKRLITSMHCSVHFCQFPQCHTYTSRGCSHLPTSNSLNSLIFFQNLEHYVPFSHKTSA